MCQAKRRGCKHGLQGNDYQKFEPRQLLAGDFGTEVSDTTFLIVGTDGSDTMEFIAGEVEHILRLNGNERTIPADQYSKILFETDQAGDSILVSDTSKDERFKFWADRFEYRSDSFIVKASGFGSVVAASSEGDEDRAYLYGSTGDDLLHSNPLRSNLTRPDGSTAQVEGASRIYIYGEGGVDVANFEDGIGNEIFKVKKEYAILDSDESYVKAIDFQVTDAVAIHGGYDKAYQYDTEADDLLVISDDRVRLVTEIRDSSAIGFERNYSYARNGGTDYVRVYDTVFDENFTFDALFDDTGKKNGFEAAPNFVRLFSGSFYRRAEGFVVSDVMEITERRLVGEFDSEGAVGVNVDYAASVADVYFIEMQRYGAEMIRAGLGIGHDQLVDEGMLIIQWGVDQQSADGSFVDSTDQVHSTSLFINALAASILDLGQFNYEGFDEQVQTSWTSSLVGMTDWLIENDDATAAIDLEPFGHRYFMRAVGLKSVAAITGESRFDIAASEYLDEGLSRISEDGVILERGGFDMNYQTLALSYLGQYYRMTDSVSELSLIQVAVDDSYLWVSTRIDSEGNVDLSDSTRSSELTRDGNLKKFDYHNAVRAYLSAYEITDDIAWLDLAMTVFQHDSSV